MADLKISDHTPTTIGADDWVPVYRTSAVTSDLRVQLGTAAASDSSDFAANPLLTPLDAADQEIQAPVLVDHAEKSPTSSVSGAVTRSYADGSVQELTLTGDVTSLTISNVPASGNAGTITFILKQDATGSRAWAHPSGIKWAGGSAPTLTTTANAINILSYLTRDGGTTWYGFLGGAGFV